MKKSLLLLFLVIGILVNAKAQAPQRSPAQQAMNGAKTLQKKLKLTDDQAAKVKSILLNRAAEIDSLQKSPSGNKQDLRKERNYIRHSTQQQVMAVLNTQQQQEFSEMQKERKAKNNNKKTPVDDTDGDKAGQQ